MTYNLTAVANANNTVQMFVNVNTHIMDGWLGVFILIVIFAVLYINFVFHSQKPIKSFTGASFITAIVSILFFIVGFGPVLAVWVLLVGVGLSIAFWNLD